jgi:hypothetical protein
MIAGMGGEVLFRVAFAMGIPPVAFAQQKQRVVQ